MTVDLAKPGIDRKPPRTAARRSGVPARADGHVAEILRAAANAFMLKGYTATSIDDVADVLGCTKGRIYHHFRSKADLFFRVHEEAMAMVMEDVTAAADGIDDPLQRIAAMSRAHVLVIMREIAFQCVVVQGLEMHLHTETTPQQRVTLRKLLALRDRYEQLFVSAMEQAIRDGAVPAQDVHAVAKALLGALNWTTIWYRPRRAETEGDRAAMADAIAQFCVRGLGDAGAA
ncbi:MAG: TetR/AcrR family transcriptional regulator [Burkholderiales bacterium]